MNEVTTAIVLMTKRVKKDGTYPVKLRITYQRKQKYYSVKHSFTVSDFDKIITANPRGKWKDYRLFYNEIENKAKNIINSLPEFSFQLFEERLKKPQKIKNTNVFAAFDDYIELLRSEDRIGTANSYNNAVQALRKFAQRNYKNLEFAQINPEFLKRFEMWQVKEEKNSISTVGIYLRSLRSIFNKAIEEGTINAEIYPFGKRKYQIPNSRNVKKALTLGEMESIFKYEVVEGSTEHFCKDLFIFSYLCNGMNVGDIARLKYENFFRNKFSFLREKTKRTKKSNLESIVVVLTPKAEEIIKTWGNLPKDPDNYVFPILKNEFTEIQKKEKIHGQIKLINKYMGRIGEKLGIKIKLTTYVARHTHSSILMKSGTPVPIIKNNLGHSSIKITELYLDSFEDQVIKDYMGNLTSFEKNPEE